MSSVALLALASLGAGCAHVRAPEAASPETAADASWRHCRDDETIAAVNRAEAHDALEAPVARPPERHSISLGTTFVPSRWHLAYGSVPNASGYPLAAPVVINNYNQINTVPSSSGTVVNPYYYPAVGYSTGYPVGYANAAQQMPNSRPSQGTGATTGSSQTPPLGGDWPGVPSYGPKMPTKTAPASTWAR